MVQKTHHFAAGDVVEVRSVDEILATLDGEGKYEGVRFMDEMRQFCGRRFRVFKRADKVCVERPFYLDLRRMRDAVFLDEVRCDGSAHDGCARLCMIFWKEIWLKPARGAVAEPPIDWVAIQKAREATGVSLPKIDESKSYACQSTELLAATERLRLWDIRHFVRDLRSGSLKPSEVLKSIVTLLYNKVSTGMGGHEFGKVLGTAKRTPTASLHLRAGELVRVKRKDHVALTLDARGKNRGLSFGDVEVTRHCGTVLPVLGRVDRMILEDSGKMKSLRDTVLLQGTACTGMCFRGCARNGLPLWREVWLERVGTDEEDAETVRASSTPEIVAKA